MRKFIVSDLHGNGNVYKSMMSYLENLNLEEPVILYINGDLIDKGQDSGNMLLDVKSRIANGPFKIVYLGGNHELSMLKFYRTLLADTPDYNCDWFFCNGGRVTEDQLEDVVVTPKQIADMVHFISNLRLYHVFDEKLEGKNIALAHASCSSIKNRKCKLKLKSDVHELESILCSRSYPYKEIIGNNQFFSIVGHTPNYDATGVKYNDAENYLNIDGGCVAYVLGHFDCDHAPLVEVDDGFLRILTFNNNNEILYGNYFINNRLLPFSEKELDKDRGYLDKSFKPKKLVRFPSGIIQYEDWKEY